jgi:purine-nucleoside phosphorylase
MQPSTQASDVADAVAYVREQSDRRPEIVMVLGSGLGAIAETAEDAVIIETSRIPGYPRSTVEGHQGRLILGSLEGRDVLFVQGRAHLYEGHPIRTVTFPIRLAHALGAQKLLVTNAAGGINPTFHPGTLMFISDHVNFAFVNPLAGPNTDGGPRFPDMSAPYDPDWLDRAEALALQIGVATRRGVYLWTLGPSYETKAEISMHARLGADAIGMSTVPEVIQARYMGMSVLGLSTITNYAAGLSPTPLDHEEVLEVGRQVRGRLERLVRAIVGGL